MAQAGFSEVALSSKTFVLGNSQVDVVLTDQGISWTGTKGKSGSVDWRDVLAVSVIEKPKSTNLQLSYTSKPSPEWRKAVMTFTAPNIQEANDWVQTVCSLIREKATERPKKLYVVVNPKSGSSNGVKIYQNKAAPLFKLANIDTEVLVTERAGHAKEVLSQLDLSQYDGIVSVGGDGTYTEVLNGLQLNRMKAAGTDMKDPNLKLAVLDIPVGIIPAGTGQGMIVAATGSKSSETAALNIICGHSFRLPMFTVHNGSRHLVNGCLLVGYGIFSKMIVWSESNRQMGPLRYLYSGVKAMAEWRPIECEVEVLARPAESGDGDTEAEGQWVKKSGSYLNVTHFMYDVTFPNLGSADWIHCYLWKPVARLKLCKFLMGMMKMKPTSLPEWIEAFPCTEYRMRPAVMQQTPPPAAGSEGEQGATARDPESILKVLNVDGDPFTLDHPEVIVRLQRDVVKMFGYREHMQTACGETASETD